MGFAWDVYGNGKKKTGLALSLAGMLPHYTTSVSGTKSALNRRNPPFFYHPSAWQQPMSSGIIHCYYCCC